MVEQGRSRREPAWVHAARVASTAASLAVSQGASVLAVQRMLGHDKPSTTLDVYSDLFDDDLEEVAARLDAARESYSTAYGLRTEVNSEPIEIRSMGL